MSARDFAFACKVAKSAVIVGAVSLCHFRSGAYPQLGLPFIEFIDWVLKVRQAFVHGFSYLIFMRYQIELELDVSFLCCIVLTYMFSKCLPSAT